MFERPPARVPTRLVPKEEVGTWRRWQTARLDIDEDQPIEAAPVIDEAEQLAAELATLREQARAAGHAEGFKKGHAAGLAQGQTEGLEKGRTAGHAEGVKHGEALARAQAAALQTLAETCGTALAGLEAGVAQALTKLAIEVAREVVRTELATHPEHIVAVVREVLHDDTATKGPVQVFVNPEDAALLIEHLGEQLTDNHWRVVADATVERGGCRVQSPYGDIDATLQTRWRRVVANLGSEAPWQPV